MYADTFTNSSSDIRVNLTRNGEKIIPYSDYEAVYCENKSLKERIEELEKRSGCKPNILDNACFWDFVDRRKINIAKGDFCIDRWYTDSISKELYITKYTNALGFNININDNVIINQKIYNKFTTADKTLTFTIKARSSKNDVISLIPYVKFVTSTETQYMTLGKVDLIDRAKSYSYTFTTPDISYDYLEIGIYAVNRDDEDITAWNLHKIKQDCMVILYWMKLEENPCATVFRKKDKALEELECNRHFLAIDGCVLKPFRVRSNDISFSFPCTVSLIRNPIRVNSETVSIDIDGFTKTSEYEVRFGGIYNGCITIDLYKENHGISLLRNTICLGGVIKLDTEIIE